MNLRGDALLLVSFPSLKHVNNITNFPKPLGHIRGRRWGGPERFYGREQNCSTSGTARLNATWIPFERNRASRIQQKILDRLEERWPRRLVPLRHMVLRFQSHELGIRNRRRNATALLKGYEIVVTAMHDQGRRGDLGQQLDDVDLVEGAAQPDGVFRRRCPALEFREPPDQLGRRVGKEPRAQHLLKRRMLVTPAFAH
jgi:hypothetical protein